MENLHTKSAIKIASFETVDEDAFASITRIESNEYYLRNHNDGCDASPIPDYYVDCTEELKFYRLQPHLSHTENFDYFYYSVVR